MAVFENRVRSSRLSLEVAANGGIFADSLADDFKRASFGLWYMWGVRKPYFMMHAAQILVDILRNAWTAIIGLMVAVAVLAGLYQILKLSVDASLGASMYVAQAVGALIALIIVALYAFLAIPAIVRAVTVSVSISTACGPAADVGQAAAYVMAAIAAVRMAKAAFTAMFSAMSGAGSGMSDAITEAGEAVLGMLLISVAVPVVAAFLGAC